jgi:hypothetical protein
MRRSPDGTTEADVTRCPPPPGYDWTRFGRHVFRVAGNTVIDFPVPIVAGSAAWIAQVWPDARHNRGWAGWAWQPDPVQGRGWLLPERLSYGDVIEFGVDRQTGRLRPTESARWWGIVTSYDGERLLTIQGPYPSPSDAHLNAEQILGADRYEAPGPPPDCGRSPMPSRGRPFPADHPSHHGSPRHHRCRGKWAD